MRYHVFRGNPEEGPVSWLGAADGEDACEAVSSVVHEHRRYGGTDFKLNKEGVAWAVPIHAWGPVSVFLAQSPPELTLGELSMDEAKTILDKKNAKGLHQNG